MSVMNKYPFSIFILVLLVGYERRLDAGLYIQIFGDLSIPHVPVIIGGAGSLDWGALGAE